MDRAHMHPSGYGSVSGIRGVVQFYLETAASLLPWKWRQHACSKCWCRTTQLQTCELNKINTKCKNFITLLQNAEEGVIHTQRNVCLWRTIMTLKKGLQRERMLKTYVYNNTSFILLVNYILRRKHLGTEHTFKQTFMPAKHKMLYSCLPLTPEVKPVSVCHHNAASLWGQPEQPPCTYMMDGHSVRLPDDKLCNYDCVSECVFSRWIIGEHTGLHDWQA